MPPAAQRRDSGPPSGSRSCTPIDPLRLPCRNSREWCFAVYTHPGGQSWRDSTSRRGVPFWLRPVPVALVPTPYIECLVLSFRPSTNASGSASLGIAVLRRLGCSGFPSLARHRRPRGGTPVRLPDLSRGRPSIRCDIHVATVARIKLREPHLPWRPPLLAQQRRAAPRGVSSPSVGLFTPPCVRPTPASQRRDFDSPSGFLSKGTSNPLPPPVARCNA